MFSFGGTLELLDSRQVSGPDKAVANARALRGRSRPGAEGT